MREFLDAIRFIPAGGNRVSVGFINETDGKYLFSILNRYLFFSLFSFLHKDFLNLTTPQPRNPAISQPHIVVTMCHGFINETDVVLFIYYESIE